MNIIIFLRRTCPIHAHYPPDKCNFPRPSTANWTKSILQYPEAVDCGLLLPNTNRLVPLPTYEMKIS